MEIEENYFSHVIILCYKIKKNNLNMVHIRALAALCRTGIKDLSLVAKDLSDVFADNKFLNKIFRDKKLYSIQDDILHINDIKITKIVKYLKIGEIETAFKKINSSFDINKVPSNFISTLKLEYINLPAFRLHRIKQLETRLKTVISDVAATAHTIDHAVSSGKLQKIGKILSSNKKLIGFSLGIGIPVGMGFTAFISKYRAAVSGCLRYENINGFIRVCKVNGCSCYNKSVNSTQIELCQTANLPSIVANAKCDETSSVPCIHCDTVRSDPLLVDPNVEFRCVNFTFWEAAADFLGNNVESLINDIGDLEQGAIGLFKSSLSGLTFIVPIILGILALCAGIFFVRKMNKSPEITYAPILPEITTSPIRGSEDGV